MANEKKKVFDAIFESPSGETFRKSFTGATNTECSNKAREYAVTKNLKGGKAGSWHEK